MKLVSVYLLQILLLLANYTVSVYSNFMENLVILFKATSNNHSAFDLKKLMDKSDEDDRLHKEKIEHDLVDAGKYEDKSNHTIGDNNKYTVNNTNLVLHQLPKDLDFNSTKNSSGFLQIFEKESIPIMEDKSKGNNTNKIVLQLLNDANFKSTETQKPKNHTKEMDDDRVLEKKFNVGTPFSTMEGRRMHQDEQRNENKDYVQQVSSSSSSREFQGWKEEFQKQWKHKKFEALNESRPSGDNVNMLAARPWGVPCGDPAQHDMPWGNCLLAMECEPEYRIYRGDFFCGRTTFVCCSLQLNTFDMYQGFEMSFEDRDYSTDSEEKRDKEKSSKENRKKKLERDKRKRQKARQKATLKIRKNIKKIIKEIRKILNKQYRNGTRERKRRTGQLKKFIKSLKKQYKKDRKAVKEAHEKDMVHIDNEMQSKLAKIKVMNEEFMRNETFRDIVVNGSITKLGARMLLESYPELEDYMEQRRKSKSRRSINRNVSDEDLLYDVANEYN